METHQYEITLIGAGPVGMFAAFYAGLHTADTLVLESLGEVGGQPANLYPAKTIYDIGGYPSITGAGLTDQLHAQLDHFNPTVVTGATVTAIEDADSGFTLKTTAGDFHTASVIIASGGGAFTPRPLAVDYDHALDGQSVLYNIRDPHDLAGLDVAIAGGGDSAIDWALALAPVAKSVHLIHRRNQFRGLESSVAALAETEAQLHTPYLIAGVQQQDARLNLQLAEVRGTAHPTLSVDRLLVNYGFVSANTQLQNWGVALTRNEVVVDTTMATSRPGIYAIGDAVTYPGKLKLIASGFGEAPTAVNAALLRLHPDRRQPLHSTQLYH
ncbi:NAD(P)/FAD-dependent oxidoreductase [Lacticaseibacillus nasuensis]|uniref:NAD(P)/FAD-dependent oxidoreductase n=1 Tax=Lacticaseibacillus nasuensis TaxID=944671 RepID=UPI002247FF1A|nr:NAD(P)/FAD-dependent oxidoreductase [Lacticaseibacillus nasuensis]MCX2456555.1 NAD(P)/FAD-dependent oxidoreductase [Lacticaseibacillus nasuensis]